MKKKEKGKAQICNKKLTQKTVPSEEKNPLNSTFKDFC